jgi:hypothetical protein
MMKCHEYHGGKQFLLVKRSNISEDLDMHFGQRHTLTFNDCLESFFAQPQGGIRQEVLMCSTEKYVLAKASTTKSTHTASIKSSCSLWRNHVHFIISVHHRYFAFLGRENGLTTYMPCTITQRPYLTWWISHSWVPSLPGQQGRKPSSLREMSG